MKATHKNSCYGAGRGKYKKFFSDDVKRCFLKLFLIYCNKSNREESEKSLKMIENKIELYHTIAIDIIGKFIYDDTYFLNNIDGEPDYPYFAC